MAIEVKIPAVGESITSGVVSAWNEYLSLTKGQRGVVLIGHSQGAAMLIKLMKAEIDQNAPTRGKLVSAVLLGANATVKSGKTIGGSFENIPACQSAWQTGCVVAYSSALKEPPPTPANYLGFGRTEGAVTAISGSPQGPEYEVMCVNPAQPEQSESPGSLLSFTCEPFVKALF